MDRLAMAPGRRVFRGLLQALVAAVVIVAGGVTAEAQRGGGPSVAGQFDHYVLALSWSPTHCEERDPRDRDPQCEPGGRPYAFVLHGLWPQHVRGWPEFCQTGGRPFVPDALIGRMLDIMPSRKLVIHSYRKHGTCSGLEPEGYFALSRRLFESVRMPDRFVAPTAPFMIGRDDVVQAFLKVNPQLKSDMLTVTCGGSGPRLREVRICYSREGAPRSCSDSDQRRSCRADRVYVPPVREGRASLSAPADRAADASNRSPAPLPPGLMPQDPPARRP